MQVGMQVVMLLAELAAPTSCTRPKHVCKQCMSIAKVPTLSAAFTAKLHVSKPPSYHTHVERDLWGGGRERYFNKFTKIKVLRAPYSDARCLRMSSQQCIRVRGEDNFTKIGVRWLSHIVCCSVKHGHGHTPTLYFSPPPPPLSQVVYTACHLLSISPLPIVHIHLGRGTPLTYLFCWGEIPMCRGPVQPRCRPLGSSGLGGCVTQAVRCLA